MTSHPSIFFFSIFSYAHPSCPSLPFPCAVAPCSSQLFSEGKDIPCPQALLAFTSCFGRRHFHQPPVGAALGLGVVARALHSRDEATVPHACPAELAEVVQAAGDAGQQVELIEQAPGLEGERENSHSSPGEQHGELRWPPTHSSCLGFSKDVSCQHLRVSQALGTVAGHRGCHTPQLVPWPHSLPAERERAPTALPPFP